MSYAKHIEPDYPVGPGAAAPKPGHTDVAYDVEYGGAKAEVIVPAEGYASFADRLVRQGFIRKVFGERRAPPLVRL